MARRDSRFPRLALKLSFASGKAEERQAPARRFGRIHMTIGSARLAMALAAGIALAPLAAQAQIAVSANDNKAYLDNGVAKTGVAKTVPSAPPDTVAIIDLSANPAKRLAEIQAPASVAGPPGSVAVAADKSFALVTSAMKVDPADPTKQVPDDRLSVIDLKSSPPKVTQTVTVGKGAAGVSINKAGTSRWSPTAAKAPSRC